MTETQATPDTEQNIQCALGALWIALDELPDPLAKLEHLRRALHGVTGEIERSVGRARGEGATWQQIADALNLNSKQAAQARYGSPVSG